MANGRNGGITKLTTLDQELPLAGRKSLVVEIPAYYRERPIGRADMGRKILAFVVIRAKIQLPNDYLSRYELPRTRFDLLL